LPLPLAALAGEDLLLCGLAPMIQEGTILEMKIRR
jgi:hypothetical protein